MQKNFRNYYTKSKRIYFKSKPKFKIIGEKIISNNQITIVAEKDANINYDGFYIKISSEKNIVIKFNNDRGFRYAVDTLNNIVIQDGEKYYVEICELEDYPDFRLRGIIEGFYGKPYTINERKLLIEFMNKNRMNTYFYAPKDDLYHRDNWRKLYPKNELYNLSKLIKYASDNLIDFYYCISPGKDFIYSEKKEYESLYNKIIQIKNIGCEKFAILLDDIECKLSKEDENFSTSGKAHSYLINQFINRFPELKKDLIMCPTEYMQIVDSPYRTDLRQNMSSDIKVFWTGYNTIAEFIKDNDVIEEKKIFGNDIVIWDNYPVNDFEPKGRIYTGSLSNRSKTLYKYTDSYVMNPMIDFELSKSALITSSLYMWNSENYNEEESLKYSATQIFGKEYEEFGYDFLLLNENSILKPYLNQLESYFQNKNFEYLDSYYEKNYNSLKKIYDLDINYIKSAKIYIELFFTEYRLYKSIRNHKIDYNELEILINATKRNASTALLKYIKNTYKNEKTKKITIENPRTEYSPL